MVKVSTGFFTLWHADVILNIDEVIENKNSDLSGHERVLNGLEKDNSGLQQEVVDLRKRLQEQRLTNDNKQSRQDLLKQNFVEAEAETKQLWANVERAKLNVKVVQEAMEKAETTRFFLNKKIKQVINY